MMQKSSGISREKAEALAAEVLGFIAGDDTMLSRFFALSGLDPASIRESVATADFPRFMLDYLSQDESLLLAFCGSRGVPPAMIGKALSVLGGNPWERDFA